MHATPRRGLRSGGLWGGVTALLLAAGVAAWLIRPESAACAAAEPAPARGRAAHYAATSEVACSFPAPPADGLYVSVPPADYAGAAACGTYLDLTGPGGRAVRVQVVDRCDHCLPGNLDLGDAAFRRLAPDPGAGVIDIGYSPVRDPAEAGELGFRVVSGSSADWLGLLVYGNGDPLSRVDLRSGDGTWRTLSRGADNVWTVSGAGGGPWEARVADAYGHRAEAGRVELAPGRDQPSGVRLYDAASPAARAPVPSATMRGRSAAPSCGP